MKRKKVANPSAPQRKAPNLFGAYDRTGLLIALETVQRARRVDLAKHFGAELVHSRTRIDINGLIVKWPIGARGYMLALNPAFPLAAELRALLRVLGKAYPVHIATDVRDDEREIPKPAIPAQPQLEYLFDSPVRTLTLVTLEALGGNVVQNRLCHSVPNQFYNSVVTALRHFIASGILRRVRRKIQFVDHPWTPQLRGLLRAYLQADKSLKPAIEQQFQQEDQRSHVLPEFHLLGPPSVERQLIALAQHGPMSYAEMMAAAKTHADRSLHIFEEMGIIASIKRGRYRLLTLNVAHPVYAELRALLLSLAGLSYRKATDDRHIPQGSFDVDRLFGRVLRTAVLLTLHANPKQQLDAASIHRLLPEHDVGKIAQALKRYEKTGLLGSRRWKIMTFYTFNEDYPHYRPLQRLLAAINVQWPQYAAASAHTNELLYPRLRKAMHRRRNSHC